MKVSDLKPNPKNPRKITDKKLEMLKASLREFGDLSGIVFNRRTQRLVGGHQRTKVLPKDLVIHIEHTFNPPSPAGTVAKGRVILELESHSYREVDWSEQKEMAANIAANQHGGSWDYPELNQQLTELDQFGIDFELTGFTHEEAVRLFTPEEVESPRGEESTEQPEKKKLVCPNCGEVL